MQQCLGYKPADSVYLWLRKLKKHQQCVLGCGRSLMVRNVLGTSNFIINMYYIYIILFECLASLVFDFE